MGDHFVGKWKMVHSDNYDGFLGALGISWLTRKSACTSSPTLTITKNASNGSWQIKTESAFKTTMIVFTLGTEFEEERMDGVDKEKVKSTITLDHDVLKQSSKGTVEYTIIREVANEVLKATMNAKGVSAVRLYRKEGK